MDETHSVYLDYAATTPLDADVEEAMRPYFIGDFGNPSSAHTFGQRAQNAVDNARETLARYLGAQWREIVFTGSATEADNSAVYGVVRAVWDKMRESDKSFVPHIITSAIEHKAVLEPCRAWEKQGVEVTYVSPDKDGVVNAEDVDNAIKANTVLVSIMYANNEIGTIQPIQEISTAVKKKRSFFQPQGIGIPYVHTDSVQALNYLDCNVEYLGVDLMSLSAHKIYGPKGIGALYVRQGTPFTPLIAGGGQEYGRRAGTENVAGIVGFGRAIQKVGEVREKEVVRLRGLRDFMLGEIEKRFAGKVILQGSQTHRLPNNVNIRLASGSTDSCLIALDQKGIFASAGSSCNVKAVDASHVILALGVSPEEAKQSIRFSFGRQTSLEDIEYVLESLESLL